ncbi:MAG: preprotein translocase subunit SecE [Clostridia bacterium]|nr:preprotein translocase subunit SecE [Clostridia bacterium]
MSKKKPNNQSSTVDTAQQETEVQEVQPAVVTDEKAAVNVDSQNEPKKAKKTANKSNAKEKKPNPFKRFGKWCKGVFSELKKVTWLKGKDVAKNTAVVLTVVVLFFVVLLIIDYVLAGLFGLVRDGKWTTIFI